jgi:hypothetical protein
VERPAMPGPITAVSTVMLALSGFAAGATSTSVQSETVFSLLTFNVGLPTHTCRYAARRG